MEPSRDYDVIVCGTTVTNAILAASLARAGLSVLHMDPQDFYGQTDATLDPVALADFLRAGGFSGGDVAVSGQLDAPMWGRTLVDVAPRLVLGAGPLVELLVQSDVARYLEFK